MKALNLLSMTGALLAFGTQAYSQTYVIIEEGGAQSTQVTPKIMFKGDAADELYNRMSSTKVQKVKIENNDRESYKNLIPELINQNGAGDYSVKYGVHMTCAKYTGTGEESQSQPEQSNREQRQADRREKNKTDAQKKSEAAAAKKKEDLKKVCWVLVDDNAQVMKQYSRKPKKDDKVEAANKNDQRDLGPELAFTEGGDEALIRLSDESSSKNHMRVVELATSQLGSGSIMNLGDLNELGRFDGQGDSVGEDNRINRRFYFSDQSHLFGMQLIEEAVVTRSGVVEKGRMMAGLNIKIANGEARIATKVLTENKK